MMNPSTSPNRRSPRRHRRGLAVLGLLAIGGAIAGTAHLSAEQGKSQPKFSPAAERALSSAENLSLAFREVSSRVLPAVVSIENRPKLVSQNQGQTRPSAEPFQGRNPFKGTPFGDMFDDMLKEGNPGLKQFNGPQDRMRPQPRAGIGSGLVIDESGVILTNNHVVAGGGIVTVRTSNGKTYDATQVWTDPQTDIAVVKIEGATDLVAAPLGDSEAVEIGDWVLALGQPFGLESTVTAGIISAKHRGIGITDRENFLQTDAAINPGNSGGPLVNLRGEVIGINTAIHSRSGGNDGIGFAIPSNMARWVSDQLIANGSVSRAYLGVGIQPINSDLAGHLGVEPRQGVVVTNVFAGSPADQAGLETGDVIMKFGETKITSPAELQLVVERAAVGDAVAMDVLRDGEHVSLDFTPAVRPETFGAESSKPAGQDAEQSIPKLGLDVSSLNDKLAERLGMKGVAGVVVSGITPGSAADEAGLTTGMVITQVNRKAVVSVEEFETMVAEADQDLLLLVRDQHGARFVVLELK